MLCWSIKDVSPKNAYSAHTQSLMRMCDHLLYCLGQKATIFILDFKLYKVLSKYVVHLNKIKTTIVFIILIIAGGEIIHNTYETTNKISFRTLKQQNETSKHHNQKCNKNKN